MIVKPYNNEPLPSESRHRAGAEAASDTFEQSVAFLIAFRRDHRASAQMLSLRQDQLGPSATTPPPRVVSRTRHRARLGISPLTS